MVFSNALSTANWFEELRFGMSKHEQGIRAREKIINVFRSNVEVFTDIHQVRDLIKLP